MRAEPIKNRHNSGARFCIDCGTGSWIGDCGKPRADQLIAADAQRCSVDQPDLPTSWRHPDRD